MNRLTLASIHIHTYRTLHTLPLPLAHFPHHTCWGSHFIMQNDTFNSTTTNITTTATDTTTQASYSSSNAFGYSNTMKTADQALTTIFTFLFILLFIISIVLLAFKKRLYTNGWYPSITSTMYWFTLVHAGCMYYLLSITRSYLRIFSAI